MARPHAEVIGDPIAHSKSPLIHNFWLAKLGIDAEYRASHVRPDELADYFARRRGDAEWRGCNVTIPHKIAALAFADQLGRSATAVGATNCLVRDGAGIRAENTDTDGVNAALPGVRDSVCLIGAGGAALAALSSADVMSALDIRVMVRDRGKAAAALAHLDFDFRLFSLDDAGQAMAGVDGVINASPLGMAGQPRMPSSVLDGLACTHRDGYVFDMVYAPLDTELLQAARRIGRQPIDGLTMLIGQAAAAFAEFFGQPAPREYDAELRALLTA